MMGEKKLRTGKVLGSFHLVAAKRNANDGEISLEQEKLLGFPFSDSHKRFQ